MHLSITIDGILLLFGNAVYSASINVNDKRYCLLCSDYPLSINDIVMDKTNNICVTNIFVMIEINIPYF